MITTTPAATTSLDRAAAQRLFGELAIDAARHDAQLESMVSNNNRVGSGWGSWFAGATKRMLDGRDAYMALNPSDTQLAARLGSELITLGLNGGRIASAEERSSGLAYSWANALDGVIEVARAAADKLAAAPAA
jgi:hypothetical protein